MRAFSRGLAYIAAAALLSSSAGCVWAPWTNPDATRSQAQGPGAPPFTPGAAKPGWQGPSPAPAGGVQQASHTPPPNEQFSQMAQRLASLEDDRRVFAARAQQLENQLRDKDKALVQASVEIQEATAQIAKTREELQRWKLEMESVRGKLRNVERDNKTTLEAIIRTLEQFLEREGSRHVEAVPALPNK